MCPSRALELDLTPQAAGCGEWFVPVVAGRKPAVSERAR